MNIGIDLNKSNIIYGQRNMCIEKKEFGWSDEFIDFPDSLRIRIHDQSVTEYLSFNLKFIEGHCAVYSRSIITSDEMIIMPIIPEELKNANL